jgi:hypothetical protein
MRNLSLVILLSPNDAISVSPSPSLTGVRTNPTSRASKKRRAAEVLTMSGGNFSEMSGQSANLATRHKEYRLSGCRQKQAETW